MSVSTCWCLMYIYEYQRLGFGSAYLTKLLWLSEIKIKMCLLSGRCSALSCISLSFALKHAEASYGKLFITTASTTISFFIISWLSLMSVEIYLRSPHQCSNRIKNTKKSLTQQTRDLFWCHKYLATFLRCMGGAVLRSVCVLNSTWRWH